MRFSTILLIFLLVYIALVTTSLLVIAVVGLGPLLLLAGTITSIPVVVLALRFASHSELVSTVGDILWVATIIVAFAALMGLVVLAWKIVRGGGGEMAFQGGG